MKQFAYLPFSLRNLETRDPARDLGGREQARTRLGQDSENRSMQYGIWTALLRQANEVRAGRICPVKQGEGFSVLHGHCSAGSR